MKLVILILIYLFIYISFPKKHNQTESQKILPHFDSLPPVVQEMAQAAKIPKQKVNDNFDMFVDIVRFISGKTKVLPDPVDGIYIFLFICNT